MGAPEGLVEAVQLLELVLDGLHVLEELVEVDAGGGHLDDMVVPGVLLASEAREARVGAGREEVVHLSSSSSSLVPGKSVGNGRSTGTPLIIVESSSSSMALPSSHRVTILSVDISTHNPQEERGKQIDRRRVNLRRLKFQDKLQYETFWATSLIQLPLIKLLKNSFQSIFFSTLN